MSSADSEPMVNMPTWLRAFGPQWVTIKGHDYLIHAEIDNERGWFIATLPKDPHVWRVNPVLNDAAWVDISTRPPHCKPMHEVPLWAIVQSVAEGSVLRVGGLQRLSRKVVQMYLGTGLVNLATLMSELKGELTRLWGEKGQEIYSTTLTKLDEYNLDLPGSARLQATISNAIELLVHELLERYRELQD